MRYILVAEKSEKKALGRVSGAKVIITGVGAKNVIKTLKNLNIGQDDKVYNVGYCGAYGLPVGNVAIIGIAKLLPESEFNKPIWLELESVVTCYTANEFVKKADKVGCYDMELYYIASFFPQVQSIKIVSDSLDYEEYKKASFKKQWAAIRTILKITGEGKNDSIRAKKQKTPDITRNV